MARPKEWDSTIREMARDLLRRTKADCHICGEPIDYTLKRPHPGSFEVDHKVPMSVDPSLATVRSNWAAAHRSCNRLKSDKMFVDGIVRRSGALK